MRTWSKKIKVKNTWNIWKCNWSFKSQLISVLSLTGWDGITSFLIQLQIKIRQNQRIPVTHSTFHIDKKVFHYKMNITTKQVPLFFMHKNETESSIASNLLILALFPSWHYYHHHDCGFHSKSKCSQHHYSHCHYHYHQNNPFPAHIRMMVKSSITSRIGPNVGLAAAFETKMSIPPKVSNVCRGKCLLQT